MSMNRLTTPAGIVAIALATALAPVLAFAQNPAAFTVYASGLNGPRGLTFGPDGMLYIAEAGTAGANTTAGLCPQAAPAVAPYRAGRTARIVKVSGNGTVVPVAQGFPSGKVVRLNASGEIEDVITGLSVPTAMTFGPDGALYISNWGAAPAGLGQILRFTVPFGS